jgi:hypothetical protein
MKEITKSQIIIIHTLLRKKGLHEEKERIIIEASGGRTGSCSRLHFDEAQKLIISLNKKKENENDKRQRMQRHIIAMSHEMGWIKKEKRITREGDIIEVNNYDDLHAWIIKYGYLHKKLKSYTYRELPKLVTQLKEVYASMMKLKPNHKI